MGQNARSFSLGILVLVLLANTSIAQEASFVRDVAERLNGQRIQHRLKPLAYSKTLEKAAQAHAEWMARNQKMEHLEEAPKSLDEYRICNEHPANRVVNAGYFKWDDLLVVERTPTGAVVHPKPDDGEERLAIHGKPLRFLMGLSQQYPPKGEIKQTGENQGLRSNADGSFWCHPTRKDPQ